MLRHAATLLLGTLALLGATARALPAQERRYIVPAMASDTVTYPFSEGVRLGNTLYLNGTTGVLPGEQAPATAAEEARRVLDSVRASLARAGMTMDDLVSVQVFCSDLSTYAEFNRVYRTYFRKEYPARAFIGVARVLDGARYEVQGIAIKR